MSVFGIVSEFNPFHRGHEYLIAQAKDMGARAVVCAMSGNTTQRGEIALCDKYLRAESALCGGADLVLEIPFPFCSASAQGFANGAISILSGFCDTVIFGSECGDIGLLSSIAEYTLSEDFTNEYSSCLGRGEQSAAAYVSLIREDFGIELSSNDLLGVEYIKAAKKICKGKKLELVTVKRLGSDYLSSERAEEGFDSAMALRRMLVLEGDLSELEERLPKRSFETLMSARKNGGLSDSLRFLDAARFYFRMCRPHDLEAVAECEGGIGERICRVAHESSSAEDFFELLRTKRYTDAKLRRALLFGMCGVKEDDIKREIAYTNLLASSMCGRELLSRHRRTDADANRICVVTKPADAVNVAGNTASRQRELAKRVEAVYTFSLRSSAPTGQCMRKKPYIT